MGLRPCGAVAAVLAAVLAAVVAAVLAAVVDPVVAAVVAAVPDLCVEHDTTNRSDRQRKERNMAGEILNPKSERLKG